MDALLGFLSGDHVVDHFSDFYRQFEELEGAQVAL